MSGSIPNNSFPGNSAFVGNNWFLSGGSDYNNLAFVIKAITMKNAHAALVQVLSVTNAGQIEPVGMVSVQPMVSQTDGFGNLTPHGEIFNIPYMRLQGGANAIILDPQVGDIGLAVFCDRDISVVKATKAVGAPGSWRQNDRADGLYVGGFLNGTPSQTVQFSASGITITSPNAITLNATNINLNGVVTIDGNVATTGTLTNNSHAVGSTHEHTGVTTGTGTSGPPV